MYAAGAGVLVLGLAIYVSQIQETRPARITGLPEDSASVVLTEQGFTPKEITVKAGGTVTFSTDRDKTFWPASDSHPNHTIYPEFDPQGPVSAGDTWSFRFDKEGDWKYHDHLRSYFTGTIHVVK